MRFLDRTVSRAPLAELEIVSPEGWVAPLSENMPVALKCAPGQTFLDALCVALEPNILRRRLLDV